MKSILSGGLAAALLLAASSDVMAQTYRNRLPARPVSPAPATGSGLVTPFMGARAMPNFANVAPPQAPATSPALNPAINPGNNSFNNGINNGINNFGAFNPYNAGFGFSPFANPYGGFGMNPFFSPYNPGFFPGANPFATPFNPYIGNGMYNPFLGY